MALEGFEAAIERSEDKPALMILDAITGQDNPPGSHFRENFGSYWTDEVLDKYEALSIADYLGADVELDLKTSHWNWEAWSAQKAHSDNSLTTLWKALVSEDTDVGAAQKIVDIMLQKEAFNLKDKAVFDDAVSDGKIDFSEALEIEAVMKPMQDAAAPTDVGLIVGIVAAIVGGIIIIALLIWQLLCVLKRTKYQAGTKDQAEGRVRFFAVWPSNTQQ